MLRGLTVVLACAALAGCSAEQAGNQSGDQAAGPDIITDLAPATYRFDQNPNPKAIDLAQALIGETCVADSALNGYDRLIVIDSQAGAAEGRAISHMAGKQPVERYEVMLDRLAISLDALDNQATDFTLVISRLSVGEDGFITMRAKPDNGIVSDWTIACGPKSGGNPEWVKRYSKARELLG